MPATLHPMSWLYERRIVPSELNGPLLCERQLGRWSISARGNAQTCTLLHDLWKHTLQKRLPTAFQAKRILMLGLGTGDTIPLYRKRFPGAHIVAIERDPVMVQLMDEFMRFSPKDRPEVLIGDVRDMLSRVSGTFDLIIVDIYEGLRVSAAAETAAFWTQLSSLLTRDGYGVFNVFTQSDLFTTIPLPFLVERSWKYRTNWVALLRKSGAGIVGAPLPTGYRRHNATPAYLEREYRHRPGFQLVPAGTSFGIRTSGGPLTLEQYYGDTEPALSPDSRSRLVLWHPTQRTGQPKSWRRVPFSIHRQLSGFHDLAEADAYWTTWSSQAQRHRLAWTKSTQLRACTPDLERFLEAYRRSGQLSGLIRLFEEHIRHQVVAHAGHFHFFGVETNDGELVSAIATLDIPESQLSFHVTSFILPSARNTPAGVAILDLWFRAAKAKGLRFLDFDGFWTEGEPSSWKGYSRFKAQFGMTYIRYPKPLFRWVPKRRL